MRIFSWMWISIEVELTASSCIIIVQKHRLRHWLVIDLFQSLKIGWKQIYFSSRFAFGSKVCDMICLCFRLNAFVFEIFWIDHLIFRWIIVIETIEVRTRTDSLSLSSLFVYFVVPILFFTLFPHHWYYKNMRRKNETKTELKRQKE